jgi:hypothetical protein
MIRSNGFIHWERSSENMATIDFGKETVEAVIGDTIEKNILASGRLPDTFLYILNENPVPMTAVVKKDDEIKAVRIASGG